MIWRTLLLSCCLCLALSAAGQLHHKTLEQRHLSLPDRSLQFHIAAKDTRVKVQNHLVYYWVKGADLHHSRGGFEGRVLHGNFAAFYPSRQLKSKGAFRKGLKHGEWKTWYENGELKAVSNWDKGVQHGSQFSYSIDGILEHKARYKNGRLHGRQIDYLPDGTEHIIRYKKGKVLEKAAPPEIIQGQVETTVVDSVQPSERRPLLQRIFKPRASRAQASENSPKEKEPKESRPPFLKRIFKKKEAKAEDT